MKKTKLIPFLMVISLVLLAVFIQPTLLLVPLSSPSTENQQASDQQVKRVIYDLSDLSTNPVELPDSPPLPNPTLPKYEGIGADLSTTARHNITKSGTLYTLSGSNSISQSPPIGPGGGGNLHLDCSLSLLANFGIRGYVPYGTFDSNPWYPTGTWHYTHGGLGLYGEDHQWESYMIWHKVWTVQPLVQTFGYSTCYTDTTPLLGNSIISATLHFRREVNIYVGAGATMIRGLDRVYFAGANVWEETYGTHSTPGTYWYGPNVYSIDVTGHVNPNGVYAVQLYLEADTFAGLLDSAHFCVWWDDVYLDVVYAVPSTPTQIYLNDPSTGQHTFDGSGMVGFDTDSTQWTFGSHNSPIHYAFDATWVLHSYTTEFATTAFSVIADDVNATWQVSFTTPNYAGWTYEDYNFTVPSSWEYNASQFTSQWDAPTHMITSILSGHHNFTEPLSAITGVTPVQAYNGLPIRVPCDLFMRGDQYGLTPSGATGQYFFEIYNSTALVDSANGWINAGQTWTYNSTIDLLTVRDDAEYGNYTLRLLYRDSSSPLHVDHQTFTNFRVENYTITNLASVENPDGSVEVSGELGDFATGTYKVYVASAKLESPHLFLTDYAITPNLVLDFWQQNDSLITATGEGVNFLFNITNTGVQDLNDTVVQIYIESIVGNSFTYYATDQMENLTAGDTYEFNWTRYLVKPGGYNTSLRHGVYRIKLLIAGDEYGYVYLDQIVNGIYLVVTDNPTLDGYIMALHEAPVSYPLFTTTFMESELAIPGDNHFLALVEDEYHITAESTPQETYNNKLDTSLTSPNYLIATDGSLTLDSYLAGDAPSHSAYTYSGKVFQVDFFIDWGTGYEFFGSDTISINSTASYTSSDNRGHGSGTYSVWVEYSGDSFTDPSNAEEIDLLTYESTTITPQWIATVEFGDAITLYARLEGMSLGALDGYELLFEKYVGGNWLLIDTDSTNTTGWAEIVYSATDVPNTYSIRVNFTSNSFLANNSIEQSLTVEDTTPPSWVTTPSDQMIEVGSLFDYQLQATDLSGIGLWTINDTTNFAIDSSGRITNITTLLAGHYGLEVTVEDIHSNALIATFTVIVEDSTNPTWDFTPTDQIIEFGSHLSYDLDASDLSGIDSYWVNDTTLFAISPQGVLSDATTIPVGTHWVEVRAYDPTGNYCSATIKVTVMDTTAPTWVTRPTDQILNYGDALDLSLAASDLSGIALWTINDTTNFAIDSSGRLTSIVTPLPVGTYGLNVTASDPYNNRISGLMTVTVREQTTTTTGPPIPGFPLLAIIVGLVVAIGLGIRLRRRQQKTDS